MSRFNNSKRLDAIMLCMERDGPICQGIVSGKKCLHVFNAIDEIEVDHIDGNENNNPSDGSNWRNVCRSCNWHLWLAKEKAKLANDNQSTLQASMCVCEQKPAGGIGRLFDGMLVEATELAGPGGQVYSHDGKWLIKTVQDLAAEKAVQKAEAERLQAAKEDAALTPTQRVNKRCEKPFNKWLTKMIRQGHRYDFETWQNAGGNEFSCSPETIRKYLNKRTNPVNGDLKAYNDGQAVYLDFKDKHEN